MSKLKLLSLLKEDIVEQYWGLAWQPYMSDNEKKFSEELFAKKEWPKNYQKIDINSKYLKDPSSYRNSPFDQVRGYHKDGSPRLHKGIDYGVGVGTLIVVLKSGKVTTSGMNVDPDGWGAMVQINHDDGSATRYAHLSEIYVSVGDEIIPGTIIGATGGIKDSPGAGNSKGPHLHFEYLEGGSTKDPASNNNDSNSYKFLNKSDKENFESEKDDNIFVQNYGDSNLTNEQNKLIELAKSHIGKKYQRGGNGPLTFDCSGFVRYVFNEFGYNIKSVPRTSNEMEDVSQKIEKEDLDVGDLVFFDAAEPKGINDHVAMVITPKGSKTVQVIHAEGSRGVNIMSDLFGNKFYSKIISGYGRFPIFNKISS